MTQLLPEYLSYFVFCGSSFVFYLRTWFEDVKSSTKLVSLKIYGPLGAYVTSFYWLAARLASIRMSSE
jgi:hypothetical protein